MNLHSYLEDLVGTLTSVNRPGRQPNTLEDFNPVLNCVRRDDHGLPMQLQKDSTRTKDLDGGDSAHRAGLLAFCGSKEDAKRLPNYMLSTGLMVRHPNDKPWDNPFNSTRDQLIGYLAGCWRSRQFEIAESLYRTHAARNPPFTCQSREKDEPGTTKPEEQGDILAPHHLMYFRVCCGEFDAAADLAGNIALYIDILLTDDDPSKSGVENNQPLLMAVACGQLDVFVKHKPNYKEVLKSYWGGDVNSFRYQPCVAQAMIEVIELELAHYEAGSLFEKLMPPNLLAELKAIDIGAALKQLKIANPIWWLETSAKLAVAILKDTVFYLGLLRSMAKTAGAFVLELQGMLIKASRRLVIEINNFARKELPGANLIIVPALNMAAAVLGLLEGNNNDEETIEFRNVVRKDLTTIIGNTKKILNELEILNKSVNELLPNIKNIVSDAFRSDVIVKLLAEVSTASMTVEAFQKEPDNEAKKQYLFERAGICRTLMATALGYGPSALPYCLQAFAFVVNIYDVIDDKHELHSTRKGFEELAKKAFNEPVGLKAQILHLKTVISDSVAAFNKLCGKQVVGISSIQLSTFSEDYIEGKFDNKTHAAAPGKYIYEWTPNESYEICIEEAVFVGNIEKIASIYFENWNENVVLGSKTTAPMSAIEGSKVMQVSPYANVITIPVRHIKIQSTKRITPSPYLPIADGYPDGKSEGASIDARKAHLKAMHEHSEIWTKASKTLRELEGLALAVQTAFGF